MTTFRTSNSILKKNLLIDGGNLFHRSLWSVASQLSISEGPVPLSAFLRQTLLFITSWLAELDGVTSIHLFMDGKPSRRKEILSTYKEKVDKAVLFPNDPLPSCYDLPSDNLFLFLSSFYRMLGCDVYYDSNEEADDLINTFVIRNRDKVNIIASSDKDYFQLVRGGTVLYCVGAPPPRLLDEDGVISYMNNKYNVSVHPSQIRMFKALTGDTSDNIKGITRLRKKSAATLCHHIDPGDLIKDGMSALSAKEKMTLHNEFDKLVTNWSLVGMFNIPNFDSCLYNSSTNFNNAREIMNHLRIPIDLSYPFRMQPVPIHDDFLSDI